MTSGTTILATAITTYGTVGRLSFPMDTDERVKRLQETVDGSDQLSNITAALFPFPVPTSGNQITYICYVCYDIQIIFLSRSMLG